ncbi:cell division protein ZapA [Bacteroidetes bacterium endosymbiont of Geopemphigus sp.]|uniref:cell division protein ZapA n=1 Tax=Bacteroidetes bacterium endosymbiont of Geopemphigus sp. TaxID=2047937 RepID=UPI000CD2C5D7|nr:cell division protein ZapA [Bacteroidetes bacterium endosymbiont of Geopemphigus sp.]
MQERIKINVNIAERSYPMTISREEEEFVRSAVKDIAAAIKDIESAYAVRDKQDALSMCLLQYVSRNKAMQAAYKQEEKFLQNRLDDLSGRIHSAL